MVFGCCSVFSIYWLRQSRNRKYDLSAEMKQIVYLICVKNREQTGASSRSPHYMLAWLNGRAADLLAWCKSSIVGLSSKGMRAVLVASTSNQQVAGSTPVASSMCDKHDIANIVTAGNRPAICLFSSAWKSS